MESLNLSARRPVLGPPASPPQGWPAVVDHIPRCMLKGEEKVTRAATSQQSAGQGDVVSGEVIRNIDVGGAAACVVVISLSRVCQTPSPNLAVRGRGMVQFVDVSFRRMQSSTPPQVTTSCKVCKVRANCFCSPQWWRLVSLVPSTTPRPSIPTHGHTAHLASSNSVEVPT
jgi:hypothetical protein